MRWKHSRSKVKCGWETIYLVFVALTFLAWCFSYVIFLNFRICLSRTKVSEGATGVQTTYDVVFHHLNGKEEAQRISLVIIHA